MLTFCTLFNVNYLDKGLVLYDSLVDHSSEFKLYVLAMDDNCYDIIKSLNFENLIPISLSDFEDEELLKVKQTRSFGEYCWTITPSLVLYVLKKFNPDNCAYIDADLYFYSDPKVILDEMVARNASVQITGHRYYADVMERNCHMHGRYCVEYNTFLNNEESLGLLNIWRTQCLEYCSANTDGVYFADQKYMDNWVDDYPFVIETSNMGAGVAPWNIAKYQINNNDINQLFCESKPCRLLFYHFQNISYISRRKVNIACYGRKGTQRDLVDQLYIHYLQLIDKKKQFIEDKFGFKILLLSHPGFEKNKRNFIMKWYYNFRSFISWTLFRYRHKNEVLPIIAKRLNIISF